MSKALAVNLEDVADDCLRDLYELGETTLEGTVQLAIAADQRAITLTGIFLATAIALVAAASALAQAGQVNLVWIGAPLIFALAGMLEACAARSANFQLGGYEPKLLAKAATSQTIMIRGAINDIQSRIEQNRKSLESGARFANSGLVVAAIGIVISVTYAISIF